MALGLSHTKSIKGADLAIGWISSNGQVVMKDYHSVDGRRVEEDISQVTIFFIFIKDVFNIKKSLSLEKKLMIFLIIFNDPIKE